MARSGYGIMSAGRRAPLGRGCRKDIGMTGAEPAPVSRRALERLFVPGPRLGWTFRDLRRLVTPFHEPEPNPEIVREQAAERAVSAQVRYARARRWLIKPSLAAGLILLLPAGYDMDRGRAAAGLVILIAAVTVT